MVEEYDEFYFNVTTLCGKQNFIFWDDALNDFGECFISLFLVNIFIKFHIKPTTVCSNSSHSCLFQAYNLVQEQCHLVIIPRAVVYTINNDTMTVLGLPYLKAKANVTNFLDVVRYFEGFPSYQYTMSTIGIFT